MKKYFVLMLLIVSISPIYAQESDSSKNILLLDSIPLKGFGAINTIRLLGLWQDTSSLNNMDLDIEWLNLVKVDSMRNVGLMKTYFNFTERSSELNFTIGFTAFSKGRRPINGTWGWSNNPNEIIFRVKGKKDVVYEVIYNTELVLQLFRKDR